MKLAIHSIGLLSTLLLLPLSLQGDEFFEKRVRPLLVAKCYQCHAGTKTSGGLSLETKAGWALGGESGAAIIPGAPEKSLLISAINYEGLQMPPKEKGGKLDPEEIEILTTWVKNGATDPRVSTQTIGGMSQLEARNWWSYQPLTSPQRIVDAVEIDKYIDQRFQDAGLPPGAQASRRELIRRATYDLTGLPPSYEAVLAFQQDESPEAFLKVINRLLDSPEYGEHWGRHWLDVVRYADTAGENSDRPLPHAWRFRNWVVDSMNNDMPFTSFVQQQLAGDLSPLGETIQDKNNGVIATGYLAVARRYGHDINKDIHLMHEDVIDNLGKAFLGITIGCARCHDHKYDPITSRDYYALYGIFNSTKFSFPGCEPIPQPSHLIDLTLSGEKAMEYQAYLEAKAKYEANQPNHPATVAHLQELVAQNITELATALVGQSGRESLSSQLGKNQPVYMKQGEVLQLTINRNSNYGADSTALALHIQNINDPEAKWSSDELVELIDSTAPIIEVRGAHWAFIDPTNGPKLLTTKKLEIGGHAALKGWALGDNPSVYANTASTPISVWTTLPGKTLFTHPGPNEDVTLAWICPKDGKYEISGHVADAHPGAGDGVSFYLQHIKSTQLGTGLIAMGMANGRIKAPPPMTLPVAYAVSEGVIADAPLHLRGDPEQPGPEVERRWLEVFGATPLKDRHQSGRDELAQWVTSHPLLARVISNRVWQWHFGQGIVSTPNDFGSRGAKPSHPELLEVLAQALVANDFRLKPLHRIIMQSKAYQRKADPSEASMKKDPTNQLLSHFNSRRLSAEEIRDSLLVVSHTLDKTPGTNHPFPAESTWTFSQHAPFNAVYPTNKRSIYMMVQRQRRHPFLALFDGSDPNASTPVRQVTTVPTQALYFLNDEFFHSSSKLAATRISGNVQAESFLEEAYQVLFQRPPTAAELVIGEGFMETYGGTDDEKKEAFCRILLSSNEFLYVD